jgi:hypothetical protein
MSENRLTGSDKEYWHRYLPLYEKELSKLKRCDRILEFGIFKGDSVRWLIDKYPNAKIFASDILPVQPEWPTAPNINYSYVDQGKPETISHVFAGIGTDLDLIIEDGSHFPEHQKNCLVEGLKHIASGGIYILEDLHTAHPEHPYYKNGSSRFIKGLRKKLFRFFDLKIFPARIFDTLKQKLASRANYIGPLHLLLFLEHIKSGGKDLDKSMLKDFTYNSLFSPDEVSAIFQKISAIKFYRRSTLPHKCYACGSTDFKLHTLKCICGADIYSNADSISVIIHIK